MNFDVNMLWITSEWQRHHAKEQLQQVTGNIASGQYQHAVNWDIPVISVMDNDASGQHQHAVLKSEVMDNVTRVGKPARGQHKISLWITPRVGKPARVTSSEQRYG